METRCMKGKGEKRPQKLLLDTDIGPDCDDAGAIAVLHALAAMGEAELIGMGNCTSNPWGTSFLDTLNRYYGSSDLPTGALARSGFLEATPEYSVYNMPLSQINPDGYPLGGQKREVVGLYRELLASVEDSGTVICAIGPLINLADLLESEADAHSPLSGRELVRRKVERLVVMGGAFPEGLEWNFQMHPQSAHHVATEWPTPVVYAGFELGASLLTGGRLRELNPEHPVRRAYELFTNGKLLRPSWDLAAVLYAVRQEAEYWSLSAPGVLAVNSDGACSWQEDAGGSRYYLLPRMEGQLLVAVLDELMVFDKSRS